MIRRHPDAMSSCPASPSPARCSDGLGIELHAHLARRALREGVIYDLMGRLSHEDVRERTGERALMQRYAVDANTADIVERRARTFYQATCANPAAQRL
ncbi:MAG: hypothetical protein IPG64_21120 [Haliea sp.]|nr:hypothetical protein [Haliea sp.]